jgi:hypothetical protein
LASISSLLNWLEKHERIPRNPLKHVQKVPTHGEKVRPRRAFSEDEMQRLLAVAGTRKVVYFAAVHTGLRRGELAALEPFDVHLDVPKPYINARATTTKNRKQATIALHPELVTELHIHRASLPEMATHIFAEAMPTMKVFKADLAAAGIPFLDARGYRADFHSFRHTLGTRLALAGVKPRIAMEIMRHSDMRLTNQIYTDMGLLPVADAVLELPSVLGKKETLDSLPDSRPPFPAGQNSNGSDTSSHSQTCFEVLDNQNNSPRKNTPVTVGQKVSTGARYRVRTGEFAIEDQELARVDSPEDSLISDPNLAALVTTWHGLTDIQKTDILRIIGRGFSH